MKIHGFCRIKEDNHKKHSKQGELESAKAGSKERQCAVIQEKRRKKTTSRMRHKKLLTLRKIFLMN
jgi:hypothetical protein